MTIVIILNIALAIAVVGGILRLLSWAITSSSPNELTVAIRTSPIAPHPQMTRPSAGRSHLRAQESLEPTAG